MTPLNLGNDTLYGGGRHDILVGNSGADTLTGGGGKDVFGYLSALDSTSTSMDIITDFNVDKDVIRLSSSIAISNPTMNFNSNSEELYLDLKGDGKEVMVFKLTGVVSMGESNIEFNTAPVMGKDYMQASPGETENFDFFFNDSDPNGNSLTYTIGAVSGGTVKDNGDGTIDYTAPDNFGSQSISYTITDGLDTIQGVIDINVGGRA